MIAKDWIVSGIYTAHTGHPFTVNQSNNNVGTNMTGLPNVVGDPSGPQTVSQWFNVAAFQAVPSGTFGNEVRNQLTGPGFQNMDLTIQRQIRLTTGFAVGLRWDIFNLFNTVNFGLPNRVLASPATLGTITSLASDPRTMQLSVRLTF